MNNRFSLLFVVLVFICSNTLFAQKAPIKFGDIAKAELEMVTYDLDSSAPAVILCDYGNWSLIDYKFQRVVRFKILTADGLDYANSIFSGSESTAVRGRTYNLVNGEIIETKLKNESVLKERVTEDYYRLRVTMPDVKIGSVFDIEFTSPWIPNEWKFQREIPVKYSELIIPQSQYINFRKSFFGYESLFYSSSERWVSKDMPAFKKEPFTNSIENYITKFEFDILSLHFPGDYREFTTDWNAVARRLEEDEYFGGMLNFAIYLNSIADEIKAKNSTELDKIKAACKAVSSRIKWNEIESLSPTTNMLSPALKDGVGNVADINLILVNLLRKLDIKAFPVVMSTRENGLLPPVSASRNKLNYIIAYAQVGATEYLLDATDELAPVGILPFRCLNGQGRIMNDQVSTPVSLKTDKKNKFLEIYELEINSDLTLKGLFSSSRSEYGAYNFRKNFKTFNSKEEYIEDVEEEYPGLSILSCEIENLDSVYNPIKEKYEIEIQNQIYEIDNQIFINPLLYKQLKENPLKPDERKYPIDFGYCTDNTYLIKIKVPEGYQVAQLPKSAKLEFPDKAGRIIYQAVVIDNTIAITYKVNINKEIFQYNEYPLLKEFYNQIIKMQAEPIILNKI